MPRTTRTAVTLLIPACVLATGCRRLEFPPPRPVQVAALVEVLDLTGSATVSPAQRCHEGRARIAAAWEHATAEALDVLLLGVTAGEPQQLLPWTRLAEDGAAFEAPERAQQRRAAQLDRIVHDCVASATRADTRASAVYLAVARALDGIRAHCESVVENGGACTSRTVAIHGDLLDNVNAAMRRRIAAASAPRARASAHAKRSGGDGLPAIRPLPTAGVRMFMCGGSDTSGDSHNPRPGDAPADAIYRAWSGALGAAMPAAIDPTCPTEG